jgi:FixJ family two-component response regulator
VITDQAMPGMRGTELAAELAQKYPALTVILATGYAELPNGADPGLPRLSKPFRQEDLHLMLQHVVQPDGKKVKVIASRR